MIFGDFSRIIIKGTGKRAEYLMEYVENLSTSVPELYKIVNDKLFCAIDRKKRAQDKLFHGLNVYRDEEILGLKDTMLYVVAILDSRHIIQEMKDNVGENAVINDMQFIRVINNEIMDCGYPIINTKLRNKVILAKKIVACRDKFEYINELQEQGENVNDIIKALFFLYTDRIQDYAYSDGTTKKVLQNDEAKRMGVFLGQFSAGGAERVVSKLLPVYEELGYKVTLFTDKIHPVEYDKPDSVERVVFNNGLYELFDRVIDERYSQLIKKHISVACFHIPYDGYMLFYEVVLCKMLGIKTIIECHTSFINQMRLEGGIEQTVKLYKMVDRLVVLSKTDEYFWRKQQIDATYIQNPCNEYFSSGQIEKNRRTLIWVGRINDAQKGVFRIIPIMSEVHKKIPHVVLLIVGQAKSVDELQKLKDLIKQNDLNDTVIICGYQKHIFEYYEKADAMLMTSPGEGFPMAIIEAKAAGIPTIMYDLPYLEVVKDGKGIITVKQGDEWAFAKAIVDFLENDSIYSLLTKEAIESYEKYRQYDIRGAWKAVLDSDYLNRISDVFNGFEEKLINRLLVENDFVNSCKNL